MMYEIKNLGKAQAELVLYGDIGEDWFGGISANEVIRDIDSLDVENIDVRLNSPGGSVDDGIAIANALDRHDAKVTVYVDSLAASIASYIAAHAADEVVMASNARQMIHNAWTVVGGDAHDLRKVADILEMHNEILTDAYDARMNVSREEISAMMDEETWFNAQQAVDVGLADSVGESSLAAAAWFQPGRFRNAPKDLEKLLHGKSGPAPAWKREAARRRNELTKRRV